MVSTGKDKQPSLGGGIGTKSDPDDVILITIGVDSVDEFMKKVKQHGGQVVSSKKAIPGEGYIAKCKDTEGNVFSIMEEDENAG